LNIVVLHYHRIGGSGIIAYEIGRAMAEERGHNIHFMGLEPPFRLGDDYPDNIRFHKVWVKEYPVFDFQPYALALASQLAKIIIEHKIDVVHSHYALPHAVSAILAKEISGKTVKLVTTLHGTDITIVGAHPSMINITRYAIEKSDVVTTVSDFLKKETANIFNIAPNKINTVYNFINTNDFNPELCQECYKKKKGKKKIMIHISNLRDVKRPLQVIDIFYKMSKQMADLELWIIGEGPKQQAMQEMARNYGILNQIKFLGISYNTGPILACSEMMLFPGQIESFGLVALEAMACGVPVLASNSGGIPEVIAHGKDGLLFEPGKVDQAVKLGLELLHDPQRYNKMHDQAILTAVNKFSRDKIILQYENLYN